LIEKYNSVLNLTKTVVSQSFDQYMCGFVDRDTERGSAAGEYAGQPLKASCASYAVVSLRLLCE
jgi:hypothetical protein